MDARTATSLAQGRKYGPSCLPSRKGFLDRERPQEGGGRFVKTRTGPRHY